MTEKVEVVINVTDWLERARATENFPQTREELVAIAVDRRYSPREAAQFAIAGRELGLCPPDILDGCKHLLSTGGMLEVDVFVANVKEWIKINGRKIRARQWKAVQSRHDDGTEGAPVTGGDGTGGDDGVTYTRLGTPESIENARRYLQRNVPGHIRNRFVEIAAAGGDVREAGEELIEVIRTLMERYREPG